MLDMRRREEADGERRMIGSGRRVGTLGFMARDWLLALLPAEACCFLAVNVVASLRTCEKSFVTKLSVIHRTKASEGNKASIPLA